MLNIIIYGKNCLSTKTCDSYFLPHKEILDLSKLNPSTDDKEVQKIKFAPDRKEN